MTPTSTHELVDFNVFNRSAHEYLVETTLPEAFRMASGVIWRLINNKSSQIC